MIKIDFPLLVLIYTFLPLFFMFGFFLLFRCRPEVDVVDHVKVITQECSVCLHIYRTRQETLFFECPVCGSCNQMRT